MQAAREHLPTRAVIIEFPTLMGMPPISPEQPVPALAPTPSFWQRHGNTAQWGALLVTVIVGLATLGINVYFHVSDANAKVSDEHIKSIVKDQMDLALKPVNDNINAKTEALGGKIESLSERVSRIEGSLGERVSTLETKTDRQTSLARLLKPDRVLAQVRNEIQFAQTTGRPLSGTLTDYKNVVLEMPNTAYEYWATVAAIVNYQSKMNQMSGVAPDPARVSRPCDGFTRDLQNPTTFSEGNTVDNSQVKNCVVDLDTQTYTHVVFVNSVIRYRGGRTTLVDVRFVNCRFVLDLPPQATPASPALLLALLESPDQRNVVASSTPTHN
jgi:hypothetical protein